MLYEYCIGSSTGTYTSIPANSSSFSLKSLITTSQRIFYVRVKGTAAATAIAITVPVRSTAPVVPTINTPAAGQALMMCNSNIEYSYVNSVTGTWTTCSDNGDLIEFTHAANAAGSRTVYIRNKSTSTAFASNVRSIVVYRTPNTLSYDASLRRVNYGVSLTGSYYSINDGAWTSRGTSTYLDVGSLLSTTAPTTVRIVYGSATACAYQEIIIPQLDAAPDTLSIDYINETLTGLDPTIQYQYSFTQSGTYTNIPKAETFSITSLITTSVRTMYVRETGSVPVALTIPVRSTMPSTPIISTPAAGQAIMMCDSSMEYSYVNSATAAWTTCSDNGDSIEFTHAANTTGSRTVYIRYKATSTSFYSNVRSIVVYRTPNTLSYDASLRRITYGMSLSGSYYSINNGPWTSRGTYAYLDVGSFLSTTAPTNVRIIYGSVSACAYQEITIPQLDVAPAGIVLSFINEAIVGMDSNKQYQYSFTESGTYTNIPLGESFSVSSLISTSQRTMYVRETGSVPAAIVIPVRPVAPASAIFDDVASGVLVMRSNDTIEYSYVNSVTESWTSCSVNGDTVEWTHTGSAAGTRYVYTRYKATTTSFASLVRSNYVYCFPTLVYNASLRRVTFTSPGTAYYSLNGGDYIQFSTTGYLDIAPLVSAEGPITLRFKTTINGNSAYQEIVIPQMDEAPTGLSINFLNETLNGLDATKQYQYCFTATGTFTDMPKAATFLLTSVITSAERTMYIRTTERMTGTITIPARPAAPSYEVYTPEPHVAYVILGEECEYSFTTSDYQPSPDGGIEITWTQAANVVGSKAINMRTAATSTSFASTVAGKIIYRMPTSLPLYYNTTYGRVHFTQNDAIVMAYSYFSVDGGEWIRNSGQNYYADVTPYLKLLPDTTEIRVKYNEDSAYSQITVGSLRAFPSRYIVNEDTETISGLTSTLTNRYRIGGNSTWYTLATGSTSFSYASFASTEDRILQIWEGNTVCVPYAMLIRAKRPAPATPIVEYPQAGQAIIPVDSDYEYMYEGDTAWTACTNDGIDLVWTHNPATAGSRTVKLRLKETDTENISETVTLTINRMPDVTYDADEGRVYFGGTSLSLPSYSVNDGAWSQVQGSSQTNILINKYELSTTQANSIKVKYGDMDMCAYAEVALPAQTSGPEALTALSYSIAANQSNPASYNPITGTLSATTNTAYFRFEVDQANANAGFILLNDQAPVSLAITFYSADGTKVSLPWVESGVSYITYRIPTDLPNGSYYARVYVSSDYRGFAETNFTAIYTTLDSTGNFTSGRNTESNLEHHDPNGFKHYADGTLANSTIEHWYRVYFSSLGYDRTNVTISSNLTRVDFTIRSVDAPDDILYFSHDLALRTSNTGSYNNVLKDEFDPDVSGYYYVVVQAERAVFNEAYRLTVGNPRTSNGNVNITGTSMTISSANVTYTKTISATSSAIPQTAKVKSISHQSSSTNGYATVDIKHSSEIAYHSGSSYWSYTYATEWSDDMVDVRGTWNYRAKITSSSYVPKTFTPTIMITYVYEIGD